MKDSCHKCGHRGLTATFICVSQSVAIEGVGGDGLLLYGKTKSTGGRLDGVRCPNCGKPVFDDEGEPIRSLSALAGWLAGARTPKQECGSVAYTLVQASDQ